MPDYIKFPLTLMVICGIAAAALAGVRSMTKERMAASEQRKLVDAFKKAAEDAEPPREYGRFEKADVAVEGEPGARCYKLYDKSGECYGIASEGKGTGYNAGSPIQVIVAADPAEGKVISVVVVSAEETPGLGQKIKDEPAPNTIIGKLAGRPDKKGPLRPEFLVKFKGLSASEASLKRAGGKIDAITGATVTSNAVCAAVREALEKIEAYRRKPSAP